MTDPNYPAEDPSNRRRFARRPMQSTIRISTIDPELDPGSGRSFFRSSEEVSINISRGGVALRTQDPMHPGRRLLLEVDDAEGNPIEAVGRVAWVRVDPRNDGERWIGVGVEFLGGQTRVLSRLEAQRTDNG